jgi:2-polyprenyl-3-methyl-5-hydroxy-6-metoxy-1,4-benzoquinol methylase
MSVANSLLREADIRPVVFSFEQQVATTVDTGRYLSRFAEFVKVPCPACGADRPRKRFRKHLVEYVDCEDCETMYISPRPTPEVLKWFYLGSLNYAYWNKVIFPSTEAARRERIFSPRVDRLLDLCDRHGVSTQSLLDVGAGFGTFCAEVMQRDRFRRVVGVEPTPDLARTCRERGIEVIESPVEQLQLEPSEQFDVIASFEVIEHLFDPGQFVASSVSLLRPGGVLVLVCPNGKGFDIQTLGAVSNTVDHEHLNYFHPSSLTTLLRRNGLEVIECQTPGNLDAELVRNKVLEGEFSLIEQPFLKSVLIDNWDLYGEVFQQYLIRTGQSSNMWVAARKPILSA